MIITSSADTNIKICGLDIGEIHIRKSRFDGERKVHPATHNFFSSGKDDLIKYGDKFECTKK